nr:hypothetical protein [Tanacetum cinerariifolium]
QVAIDEALVSQSKRLRIRGSNFRLLSDIKSKESTLQLVYDVMRLTPFFKAFLVIADVPKIYMQEFWATSTVHHHAIQFKMDNKKHIVNLESFRDMLHICPRLPGQSFVEPPFEEEILAFLRFLGNSASIRKLTDVNINKLYQPWRSFHAIINKCLTRKSSGYDSLRLSQAQILWGLYHKRNVDYAYLMWEDFVYQDPSIPRRNKVNWHYVRDEHMFSTIKLVSRHENTQLFDALLPIELTNEDIRNSNAYKEYYAVATGAAPPKPKASVWKTRSSSDTVITPPTAAAGLRLTTFEKGKEAAKASKAESLSALSEVAMTKAQDLKLATKRSLQQTHIYKASGSSTDEGTGDDDDDQEVERDDEKDDKEEGGDDEQESDEEEFIHPSLSTHTEKEPRDEESFDPILKTPEDTNDEGNGEDNLGLNVGREEGYDEEEEEDELYRDVNINQGRGIQTTQEFEDSHVILTSKIIKEQVKEQVKTSYAVAADLSEMELKKILIEKMEGNKSIQRSDEQRNLYKALVEAYESYKIILDTYGETVTLKRRRNDDADKDEEPSAGSDRGSKRRREGKEPDLARAPKEKATMSASNIIIQRRVEDLQLGVESYQKKFNLTKSDTYRSNLKRKEAYTAYSNPRGFIYQNKDKQNRLMRIDELHKFSDETLTDVRTALDDLLKGIQMKYLPQSI